MKIMRFPLDGILRDENTFMRTVSRDGTVILHEARQAEAGEHLMEIALHHYSPGCTQEIWDISGEGAFIYRGTGNSLHNFTIDVIVKEDPATEQLCYFITDRIRNLQSFPESRALQLIGEIKKAPHYTILDLDQYSQYVAAWKKAQENPNRKKD